MTDKIARKTAIAIIAATGLLVACMASLRALRAREPHADIDR